MATQLVMSLTGVTPASAGYSGEISCFDLINKPSLAQGNADQEINNAYYSASLNVGISSTVPLDLFAIIGMLQDGFLVNPSELAGIAIVNNGPGDIEVRPGAVSPMISWLQVGSAVKIPAGASFMLDGTPLGAYAVATGAQRLDLVETGGVAAADVEIIFVGRTL